MFVVVYCFCPTKLQFFVCMYALTCSFFTQFFFYLLKCIKWLWFPTPVLCVWLECFPFLYFWFWTLFYLKVVTKLNFTSKTHNFNWLNMKTNKIERQQSTKWDRNDYMRTVTERCCYVLKMFDNSVKLMRTQCRLFHTLRCETRQNENRSTKYSTKPQPTNMYAWIALRCIVLGYEICCNVLCCAVLCCTVLRRSLCFSINST